MSGYGFQNGLQEGFQRGTPVQAVAEDEGGAGPLSQRQQDHLDDWTLAMDDEAVLETYLLRKTR